LEAKNENQESKKIVNKICKFAHLFSQSLASKDNPSVTSFYFKNFDHPIEGMNHAQAGNYGNQSGDNPATISDESVKNQIEIIITREL